MSSGPSSEWPRIPLYLYAPVALEYMGRPRGGLARRRNSTVALDAVLEHVQLDQTPVPTGRRLAVDSLRTDDREYRSRRRDDSRLDRDADVVRTDHDLPVHTGGRTIASNNRPTLAAGRREGADIDGPR